LKFEPVSSDEDTVQEWKAADHKHAFTITREHNVEVSSDPFFVVHTCQLDGSCRRQTGRNFKTFDAAVHRCSIYTQEARRQTAYHEAGHAVTAHLLGFTGVWIDMDAMGEGGRKVLPGEKNGANDTTGEGATGCRANARQMPISAWPAVVSATTKPTECPTRARARSPSMPERLGRLRQDHRLDVGG
jgi:hypothetical protein